MLPDAASVFLYIPRSLPSYSETRAVAEVSCIEDIHLRFLRIVYLIQMPAWQLAQCRFLPSRSQTRQMELGASGDGWTTNWSVEVCTPTSVIGGAYAATEGECVCLDG